MGEEYNINTLYFLSTLPSKEHLYTKYIAPNHGGSKIHPGPTPPGPTPPSGQIKFDLELTDTNKICFLYTSDIHCGGKNFGGSRWQDRQVFSLDYDQMNKKNLVGGDVKAYQNKLIASGIPTYLLDCGDGSKGGNYRNNDAESKTLSTVIAMDYFGITLGNGEGKRDSRADSMSYLKKAINKGMKSLMACNITDISGKALYPGNVVNSDLPGCKTIKVGNKKIAIIAVGFPSANGPGFPYSIQFKRYSTKTQGGRYTGEKLRFFDSLGNYNQQLAGTVSHDAEDSLYKKVQSYIDILKTNNFDYIIVFCHLDRYSNEDYGGETGNENQDSRFYSRADFLIKNTSGINILIPGHGNQPISSSNTYQGKDKKGSGRIIPEAGGEMNSFGRLIFDFEKNTYEYKLLTSVSDLRN